MAQFLSHFSPRDRRRLPRLFYRPSRRPKGLHPPRGPGKADVSANCSHVVARVPWRRRRDCRLQSRLRSSGLGPCPRESCQGDRCPDGSGLKWPSNWASSSAETWNNLFPLRLFVTFTADLPTDHYRPHKPLRSPRFNTCVWGSLWVRCGSLG